MSDDEFLKINDPNSVFFFEVMYKCGNPFLDTLERTNNWNENAVKDVTGPTMDTVKILTLNGMTYVKLKVGSFVQFWLFDTGASDLLITDDMETELKKEHVVTDSNYLGTGEYEMANGMIDICRKYIINNVRIGRFYLNNILIAVSDKAKRVIVGKGLMNKFKSWTLDNKENTLILNK
jgi:predicted aspartyl protease